MSNTELSGRDRKDIEKFTKYLIHKYVQTVVQSRQGLRIATRSKQFSSSDWFNLSIVDQADVFDFIKSAFSSRPAVSLAQPLCIEISLRTTENETMTLEYWCLHTTHKTCTVDSSYQVAMAVYNNITILLKSLITVTRLTPAYQLSRQQSADTYSIRYDIRFEEPSSYNATDNCYHKQQVGVVPSPLGAIVAYVVYRTRLSISPQRLMPDLCSTIKDDHFTTPQSRNVRLACRHSIDATGHSTTATTTCGVLEQESLASSQTTWSRQKRAAFGPTPSGLVADSSVRQAKEADLPFVLLLEHAKASQLSPVTGNLQQPDKLNNTAEHSAVECANTTQCSKVDDQISQSHSLVSSAVRDDFVMVELKAPFASQEDELGRFYRDCQMAPTLSMFEQTCSLQEMLGSISNQLVQFEATADEFNEFVSSLQQLD